MRIFSSAIAFLLVTGLLQAQPLSCLQKIAFGKPSIYEVRSRADEKVLVINGDGYRVYLSEKEDQTFELEAFIAENEIRIYSKANLKTNSDLLELSYWSRDLLLQWTCSLNHSQDHF